MCIALVLLCSNASAATVPESVPLGRFVRVTLDEGEKAIVLSQDFAPVDIVSHKSGLAFTGLPGRYVVVILKGDEQPQQFFVSITGVVPPGPDIVPPTPDVTPPTPDTDEAPIPGLAGFKVLLIYETSDLPPKVPASQYEIKVDPRVTRWLTANTTPEDGWAGWRVGDPDSGVAQSAMHWEKMLSLKQSTPWVVVNNGTRNVGFSGPMPANADEFLKLVEKYK